MKNTVRLTIFAVLWLATLTTLSNTVISAQELVTPSSLKHQAGVYELSTKQPINTLLVPVNPEHRWNVVYQQDAALPIVTPVQYDTTLHVFIAVSELSSTAGTQLRLSPQDTDTQVATPAATTTVVTRTVPTPTPTTITISKSDTPVEKTTKPKATATPSIQLAPSELDGLFEQYGAEYGVSATVLKHIAKCESGLNPAALSKTGLYGGLFQFVSSTWEANRKAMGLDPNPELRFNAEEAIKTAAFKISRGGIGAWPVCGKKATATLTASI